MALTTTTLAAAVAVNDTSISVASATGFAKGEYVRVGDEWMLQTAAAIGTIIPVFRGVNTTVNKAHATGANVTVGTGDEFAAPAPTLGAAYPLAGRARLMTSYTADGAISLGTGGTDTVAVLNGTSVLAMTLVVPTKDMDGDILIVIGNGKAAHTLTFGTAIGNAGSGYTVLTFPAGGQVAWMGMAMNGIWVALPSPYAGTVTNIDLSIS